MNHIVKDDAWQVDALCAGMDPELFHPERGVAQRDLREAKAVCAACPVREPCLAYALTPPVEKFGIWGGFTWQQRRRMRNARRAATTTNVMEEAS